MVEVYCSQKVVWLRRLRSHTDLSTRESASRLLGMASCALSDAESCSLLSELIASVSQPPQKLRCCSFLLESMLQLSLWLQEVDTSSFFKANLLIS